MPLLVILSGANNLGSIQRMFRATNQRCFVLLNMTVLIAEGNIDVTRGLYHFAVRRNQFEPIDGFRDRHLAHLIILVADHRSKMSFVS